MCFLALSPIKVDDGWAQATEVIAKLMFCIQSVFLFCVHVGQERTGTLHKWYQALERWHYEGEESTFQKLSMLQHIASSIAYTTPTLSAFIWYNEQQTKFIWYGSKITLAMLREIGQILLKWTHQSFIKNVLLGYPWKMTGHTADDLSDTSPGYSFIEIINFTIANHSLPLSWTLLHYETILL